MKRGVLTLGAVVLTSNLVGAQEATPDNLYGIQYGSADTFAEFHGFVNLEFYKFKDEVSSFDIHNFYFNAIAKVRKDVTVFGEVEYEHGLYGDPGNLKLDRAFVAWRLGEGLAFRIGKFYTPFGLEIRNYQAPVRKLVSRPLVTEELLYDEWTEVGVGAYGSFGPSRLKVSYDLALTNGPRALAEDGTQGRDNNSNKAVLGRLTLRPGLGEEGTLEVGVSFGTGRYDDAAVRTVRHVGADARLRASRLDLVAEYVRRTGTDQVQPGLTVRARGDGYYLQAGYLLVNARRGAYSLEPIVRYDRSDLPDHDPATQDTSERRWTVGVNYSPYEHFRFKAEYQSITGNAGKEKTNGVMLAAVADF